jgi:hypothetical protein
VAPFRHGVDDGRIDLGILVNGAVFIYYDAPYMKGIVDWFQKNAYRLCEADCSGWTTEAAAWRGLSTALGFPELPYSVEVLDPDMLNDSLEDIEIPDESGTVLILREIDRFMRSLPDASHRLLDSLAIASRYHSLFGLRFMTIALCRDEDIRFLKPVGGMTPLEER